MKFQVTIDRDEDGVWVVECPAIPGCVSQGETRAEALRNVEDAIKMCVEVRAERGMWLQKIKKWPLDAQRPLCTTRYWSVLTRQKKG